MNNLNKAFSLETPTGMNPILDKYNIWWNRNNRADSESVTSRSLHQLTHNITILPLERLFHQIWEPIYVKLTVFK